MKKRFTMLLASLFLVMGTAWAQPEVGKEYRIKESTQNLYLTIGSYNGEGEAGSHGTVPLLEKATENSDQVWILEGTGTADVYYLKSRSGYYLRHGGWNINAYNDGGAKAQVQFVQNGETYKIKNMDASQWWKSQSVSEVWYPFCDATAESAAADWTFEELSVDVTISVADATAFGAWTTSTWTQVTEDIPSEVTDIEAEQYPDKTSSVWNESRTISLPVGYLQATLTYANGDNRLDILGADLLDEEGAVVDSDYHFGYSGSAKVDNTYTLEVPADGIYTIRYWVTFCNENNTSIGNITLQHLSDLYEPANTGTRTSSDRKINTVSLGGDWGASNSATLTHEGNGLQYVDLTATTTMQVYAGETVTAGVSLVGGHWIHAYAYIDLRNDGFTAGIASDGYTPTGDLVSYSFYGKDGGDTEGYNSVGEALSGDARNTLVMPSFTAPATPGTYRMRFKTDWNNIQPDGSGSGFVSAWGTIVDVTLEVLPTYTVTYNFVHGGATRYTQQTIVPSSGVEYPDITVKLPDFVTSGDKPTGTVTSDVTAEIELTVDLPFNYAASYSEVESNGYWYYLKFDTNTEYPYCLRHTDGQDYIGLSSTAVEKRYKDYYSWGFVGNPFDGFQIVNRSTGATKILSSSTNTSSNTGADTWPIMTAMPMPDGNNTYWIPTVSTHATDGFFLAQKDYPANRMNNRGGKLAYWTENAGAGSTFVVEARPVGAAADLDDLILVAEDLLAEIDAKDKGTTVGYWSQDTYDALAEAKAAAEAIDAANVTANDVATLQAAINATTIILPAADKYYYIVSATPDTDARSGQKVYVNEDGAMYFANTSVLNNVFQFEAATGGLYLYNVERRAYLNSAKAHGYGQLTAAAASSAAAVPVIIADMDSIDIVSITPVGGAMMHAQAANSAVVAWDNNSNTGASAWRIVEVDEATLTSFIETFRNDNSAVLTEANTLAADEDLQGTAELTALQEVISEVNGSDLRTVVNAIPKFPAVFEAAYDRIRESNKSNVTTLGTENSNHPVIVATARSNWGVGNDATSMTTIAKLGLAADETDLKQQFAFITPDSGANHYLYSISKQRYLKSNNTFSTQGEPVVFNDASSQGADRVQVQFKDNASGYVNVDGGNRVLIDGWSEIDAGNACEIVSYNTLEFDLSHALKVFNEGAEVTVKYMHDGDVVLSQNELLFVGDTKTIPCDWDYTAIDSITVNGAAIEAPTEGDDWAFTIDAVGPKEVIVNLSYSIPFTLSVENDTTWHALKIRTNKYVVRGETAPYANTTTRPTTNDALWAFVGNPIEGIQVLNKAAGEGKTLGHDGSNVAMVEGVTTWNVLEGNGGFLLRQGTEGYKYVHDLNGKLNYWENSQAATDNGSAFVATTEVEMISLAAAAKIEAMNYIALYEDADYFTYADDTIATAKAAIQDLDVTTDFPTAMTSWATIESAMSTLRATEKNGAPAVGDLIILKNRSYGSYLKDNGTIAVATNENDLATIWKVVEGDGGFKLQNNSTGNNIGAIKESKDVPMQAVGLEGDTVNLAWSNPAEVYAAFGPVDCGNREYGHIAGHGNLVGWSTDATATQWILSKATTLNITYKLGDVTSDVKVMAAALGQDYIFESPYNFTTVAAVTVGGTPVDSVDGVWSYPVTGTADVTITLAEENMPFQTTTITDGAFAANTEWYILRQRTANNVWCYASDAEPNVVIRNQAYDVYDEASQWCFIGNAIEGYKVYNKVAGATMSLNNAAPAVLVASNEAVWTIENSTKAFTDTDSHFALKRPSSNYANEQGGTLKGWSLDAGSTTNALSVSEELAAIADLRTVLSALVDEATIIHNVAEATVAATLTTPLENAQVVDEKAQPHRKELEENVSALTTAINATKYITEVDKFTNKAVYTFVTVRGWMGASSSDNVISTARTTVDPAASADNTNFQWTVYESARGYRYLYNIGKQKFMGVQSSNNTSVPFADTPQGLDLTFKKSSSAEYPIMFSTDNAGVANHSSDLGEGLVTWADGWNKLDDEGSNHQVAIVAELSEATLSTIAAAVEAYEVQSQEVRNTAIAALETAIAAAQAKVDAASDALGYYSSSIANVDTELAAIVAFKEGITESTTVPEIEEQTAAAEAITASFSLNLPEAGKFYRIKNNSETGYLSSGTGTGRTQFVDGIGESASSVFYYTGTKLLDYTTGLYLANTGNFLCYTNTIGDAAGTTIAFSASPVEGKLLIAFNNGNRSFYSAGTGNSDAASKGQTGDNYRFTVEEVTELPVTVGTVGYSTFYTPVAVTVPGTVTAYVIAETLTNSVALKEVTGVVPAATGLILEGEGDHTFAIATEGIPAEFDKGLLKGSAAKTLVTPEDGYTCYVLAKPTAEEGEEEKPVGLYKAALNRDAAGNKVDENENGVSFLNNANKVYLSVEVATQAAPAMFSFRRGGDTTDIEGSALEAQGSQLIYDLSGRRVLNPTKGMYIVNGKKVIIK